MLFEIAEKAKKECSKLNLTYWDMVNVAVDSGINSLEWLEQGPYNDLACNAERAGIIAGQAAFYAALPMIRRRVFIEIAIAGGGLLTMVYLVKRVIIKKGAQNDKC